MGLNPLKDNSVLRRIFYVEHSRQDDYCKVVEALLQPVGGGFERLFSLLRLLTPTRLEARLETLLLRLLTV
ncbi:MAG: hypothetical protein ACUVQY_08460 [Thermoproteota archaeon]